MTKVLVWSSNALTGSEVLDSTNNVLDITLNGIGTSLTLAENPYMTSIIRHESRLVDEINQLLLANSLAVKCKLGVIANGIDKQTYVVFEHEDTDTFSYDGTFKTVIDI